ncbi:MAG TPA: ATP synthase subunit I [Pyrinomonadaceae bacterium]|nr:ATP synthase subunit I [Chloracidobacterium sp.]MBP9935117.1 ATP synthase subunit I [Pyrinomonadaceae bacterium]MBK7803456.1 ATP synthase subunit I [Chloracidobacterium sp.]MBK9438705.1 ATP synthase subunit I [Chloracidobacterium sp.]MBK9766763.1 ATP synthase subunit I [Chloracidobacterium sp.]
MVDDLDPLTSEQPLPPELSQRRILFIMGAVVSAGTIVGSIFVSGKFGAAAFLGGVASILNFFWQRGSTKALFDSTAGGERPLLLAIRYLLRYVVLGAFVAFFYFTGLLPVTGIILGLASFALAVVVEGLLSIFYSSN